MAIDLVKTVMDGINQLGPEPIQNAIDYVRSIPYETRKEIADHVSGLVNLFFIYGLGRQVHHYFDGNHGVHPHMSLGTAIGCGTLAASFEGLLNMHYAAATNVLLTVGWSVIFHRDLQRTKQKKLEEIKRKSAEEGLSLE